MSSFIFRMADYISAIPSWTSAWSDSCFAITDYNSLVSHNFIENYRLKLGSLSDSLAISIVASSPCYPSNLLSFRLSLGRSLVGMMTLTKSTCGSACSTYWGIGWCWRTSSSSSICSIICCPAPLPCWEIICSSDISSILANLGDAPR